MPQPSKRKWAETYLTAIVFAFLSLENELLSACCLTMFKKHRYVKNEVITSNIYQKCQKEHFLLKTNSSLYILKKKKVINLIWMHTNTILTGLWGNIRFILKTRRSILSPSRVFFREGVGLALTSVSEASPPKLSCIHCDLGKILWCLYSTSESYSFESLKVDKPLSKQLSGKLSTSQLILCIGSQRAKES